MQDLLQDPRLVAHVLVTAVLTSKATLDKLILSIGTDPNKCGTGHKTQGNDGDMGNPLSIAKTIEIAEMLIYAGADPNGVGTICEIEPLFYTFITGAAIFRSVAHGYIQITRY